MNFLSRLWIPAHLLFSLQPYLVCLQDPSIQPRGCGSSLKAEYMGYNKQEKCIKVSVEQGKIRPFPFLMGNPSCGRGRPLSLHILLRGLAAVFLPKFAWAAFCKSLSYYICATPNSTSIAANFLCKELPVPPALTEDTIYTWLYSYSQDVSRFPNLFSPPIEPLSRPSWKLTGFLLTPLTWAQGISALVCTHYLFVCFPVLLIIFKIVSERSGISIPCLL